MKPDLAVIIVGWNSRADLERCLPSIPGAAQTASIRMVLVDNGSTDGSITYAQEALPGIHIIRNERNLGFAAANNQALRTVEARYLLLLNPDTVLFPQALDALVHFMDGQSDAWAAGPALLNGDGSAQRTGVRFPSLWNILVEALFLDRLLPRSGLFGRHRELFVDAARPREVDYVQGSCLIIRAGALAQVGLLDEEYFMYFEETDWCRRVATAGGKVWIYPSARVVHFGGEGPGHYDERRLLFYHRSLLLYFRKHRRIAARCFLRPLIAFRSILRIAVWGVMLLTSSRMRQSALSSIRGYGAALGLLFKEPI